MEGRVSVSLFTPVSQESRQLTPWPPEILLFALRRNANLDLVSWCIYRFDGLAVMATRELAALKMESFRDLAVALKTELDEFVALSRSMAVNE